MLSRYTLWCGRRSSFRRREDQLRSGYVDCYSPRLFTILIWIVMLNILDALFTHLILAYGGTELNPVADWAINTFGNHFVVWKLTVIYSGLLLLCLCSKYRIAKAAIAMTVILYSGVVAYQIVLLSRIM